MVGVAVRVIERDAVEGQAATACASSAVIGLMTNGVAIAQTRPSTCPAGRRALRRRRAGRPAPAATSCAGSRRPPASRRRAARLRRPGCRSRCAAGGRPDRGGPTRSLAAPSKGIPTLPRVTTPASARRSHGVRAATRRSRAPASIGRQRSSGFQRSEDLLLGSRRSVAEQGRAEPVDLDDQGLLQVGQGFAAPGRSSSPSRPRPAARHDPRRDRLRHAHRVPPPRSTDRCCRARTRLGRRASAAARSSARAAVRARRRRRRRRRDDVLRVDLGEDGAQRDGVGVDVVESGDGAHGSGDVAGAPSTSAAASRNTAVHASMTRNAASHGSTSPPVSPPSDVAVCPTVNFTMWSMRPLSGSRTKIQIMVPMTAGTWLPTRVPTPTPSIVERTIAQMPPPQARR